VTFGFQAVGSKDEVLAQLAAHKNNPYITGLGSELIDLLARHISEDTTETREHQAAYVIKANGHSGGGGACTLSVTTESWWVPATATATGDAYDTGDSRAVPGPEPAGGQPF
jgi:hypothetical protein